MKQFTYIILILGFLLFNACEDAFETTLQIDPPVAPEALVLNCFIQETDTLSYVTVGRVQSLEETDQRDGKVDDATVSIRNINTGESVMAEPLETGIPINYQFNFENDWFVTGDTYEIEVEHPDFNTIRSVQTLLDQPPVSAIEYNEDGGIDQDGDDASEIILTIEDRPGKQFFEVMLFEYFEQGEFYALGSDVNLTSTDPSTVEGYNYSSLLVDDETFEGETKSLTVKFSRFYSEDTRFYLLIRGISEDYFRYSKTIRLEDESEDNPFQTPVQVYSNIEGGFGLFALFSEKSFIFDK